MAAKPILYSYFISSCSWRVRIALALKKVDYEYKAVDIAKEEQLSEQYRAINPSGQVPCLAIDGIKLTQSLAALEYLEDTKPEPALLPTDPKQKAKVREICEIIVSGIQPLQNRRLLKAIASDRKKEWGQVVIANGLKTLEMFLDKSAGKYCVCDDITMADLCLAPQAYNMFRFGGDLSNFPLVSHIYSNLMEIDAFKTTHPERQPDCPEGFKVTNDPALRFKQDNQ